MRHALAHSIPFDPADPLAALGRLPESPGVFALYPADPASEFPAARPPEPYLSKTPNLRRRLIRFLRNGHSGPEPGQSAPARSRRLQLAHMVRRIEYTATGSEFESSLCLYQASLGAFGDRARKRLRLRPPAFLRMSLDNPFPRVYPTTKISMRAANMLFGPFPSRAAAERYGEEMLNLFLLRRCTDDLHPDPNFPGCPYSEMKMCLAPCFEGCSDERYRQESEEVLAFLSTQGASLLRKLEAERNTASEALEFERAASLHQKIQKVHAALHFAGEAVRPLAALNGVLVQPSSEPGEVALFGLRSGALQGPVHFSTIGMRLANEQSGSTSLFSQPVAVEAVPLEPPVLEAKAKQERRPNLSPQKNILEQRLEEALSPLQDVPDKHPSSQLLSDHLALFTRWFYRPAARREGEIVFAEADGEISRKALLRAVSRVAVRAFAGIPDPDGGAPERLDQTSR
ncbi:MAG TPA: UvrB/UvrC motif-containing protein [Acidobacteriaceae bacterium]|nr:UvrB/UvrC motif-containing protein [Acidobacteriaceae bacterium]